MDNITTSIGLAHTVPLYGTISNKKMLNCALKSIIKNRKAFTLAETLITLTIIGVIAAMTIPTLMTNYQKQVYTTGLKKAYAQLSNAVKMLPISENCSAGDLECAGWNVKGSDSTNAENLRILSKQFKTTQYIDADEGQHCMGLYDIYAAQDCFFTDDGMIYGSSWGWASWATNVVVDVNGAKGPNISGRDQFNFQIAGTSSNGVEVGTVMPWGSKQYSIYNNYSSGYWKNNSYGCNKPSKNNSSYYCAGRVLEEGKMDY